MGLGVVTKLLNNESIKLAGKHLEVTYIARDRIEKNPKNRVSIDGIDGLALDIKRAGLEQPLVVYPKGEGYMLLTGERRLTAIDSLIASGDWNGDIPCVVKSLSEYDLPLNDDLKERYAILRTNAFNRVLTDADKMRQAEDYAAIIKELKVKGYKTLTVGEDEEGNALEQDITGRTREVVASMTGMSTGQVGKVEYIGKHAAEATREALDNGRINIAQAHEISQLDPADQKSFLEEHEGTITAKDIKEFKEPASPDEAELCPDPNKEEVKEQDPADQDEIDAKTILESEEDDIDFYDLCEEYEAEKAEAAEEEYQKAKNKTFDEDADKLVGDQDIIDYILNDLRKQENRLFLVQRCAEPEQFQSTQKAKTEIDKIIWNTFGTSYHSDTEISFGGRSDRKFYMTKTAPTWNSHEMSCARVATALYRLAQTGELLNTQELNDRYKDWLVKAVSGESNINRARCCVYAAIKMLQEQYPENDNIDCWDGAKNLDTSKFSWWEKEYTDSVGCAEGLIAHAVQTILADAKDQNMFFAINSVELEYGKKTYIELLKGALHLVQESYFLGSKSIEIFKGVRQEVKITDKGIRVLGPRNYDNERDFNNLGLCIPYEEVADYVRMLFPVAISMNTEEAESAIIPAESVESGWISVEAEEKPCNYKQYPVTIEKADGTREVYTGTPMPDRKDRDKTNWTVGREGEVVAWYKLPGPYRG